MIGQHFVLLFVYEPSAEEIQVMQVYNEGANEYKYGVIDFYDFDTPFMLWQRVIKGMDTLLNYQGTPIKLASPPPLDAPVP